jgi:hypothetical protein
MNNEEQAQMNETNLWRRWRDLIRETCSVMVGRKAALPAPEREPTEEDWKRGECEAFYPFDYREGCVGFIDGDKPVVVMLDESIRYGVAMSVESAESLLDELDAALSSPHLHTNRDTQP